MAEAKGAINVYICNRHGHPTVTRNADTGTTPYMIACPACRELGIRPLSANNLLSGLEAYSSHYRCPQDLEASHEWYRPESVEDLDVATAEHVRAGGLLLRERDPENRMTQNEGERP